MKKAIIIIISLIFGIHGFAQSCSKFYPFSKGTISEISLMDKKGKASGTIIYEVINATRSGGTETVSISSKLIDEKGSAISMHTYDAHCTGNVVSFDFKSLMNPTFLETYKDMEYDISGTNINLPNDLSVGQSLPDGEMIMNLNMAGIEVNMTMLMTDREVEKRESVTTPAGIFDCFVISYTSEMQMGMNQTRKGRQWISEGVGMVKQEDYDKKGKLTNSSLLTSFKK